MCFLRASCVGHSFSIHHIHGTQPYFWCRISSDMAVRRIRKKRARLSSEPTPTARKIRLPYPKDADGRPLCRWDRRPVLPPRRYWCSDQCVLEYRARYDTGYQRAQVLKRDHGICALCGLDTLRLARQVMALKPDRAAQLACLLEAGFSEADLRFRRRGLWPLWEADHTVPVCEGGGGADWFELRSLCRVCHRLETQVLMARRRAEKKSRG